MCKSCPGLASTSSTSSTMAEQHKQLEAEALEGGDEILWHIMPKLHLCEHLCEMQCSVKDFWTYKDETTGGVLAKFFARRGGKDNPGHNAFEVLDRWACKVDFPQIGG